GRGFTRGDDSTGVQVAIVNRTLARRLAPAGSALGLRIRSASPGAEAPWRSVVGVIEDVKNDPFDRDPQPVLFVPYAQRPVASMQFAVRVAGPPGAWVTAMRRRVLAVDPDQPIWHARPLEQQM